MTFMFYLLIPRYLPQKPLLPVTPILTEILLWRASYTEFIREMQQVSLRSLSSFGIHLPTIFIDLCRGPICAALGHACQVAAMRICLRALTPTCCRNVADRPCSDDARARLRRPPSRNDA